jgi:hypothetical protein
MGAVSVLSPMVFGDKTNGQQLAAVPGFAPKRQPYAPKCSLNDGERRAATTGGCAEKLVSGVPYGIKS